MDSVGKTNPYFALRLERFSNSFTIVLRMFILICAHIEQFTFANDLMRWKGFIWAWFMMLHKGLWFNTTSCVYIFLGVANRGCFWRQWQTILCSNFCDYKFYVSQQDCKHPKSADFLFSWKANKTNLCVSVLSLVRGTSYNAHNGQGSSSPIKTF